MRQIITFTVLFLVIGFINQSFYNFCMKSYCLGAAFPRVMIMAVVATVAVEYLRRNR